MPRLRPSNLKCVSAVIRYKIVVNIFHYSSDGGKGALKLLARKTTMVGGMEAEAGGYTGQRGEGTKQGGAGGDTGLPLSARSSRDGTAKRIVERTAGEGREKEKVQRDLTGRGEVPSKRRRVVPAPRTYSANLRIHEDERVSERANSGVRANERSVFCYVNFFAIPLLKLKKRLVKHIKEARWLNLDCVADVIAEWHWALNCAIRGSEWY